MTKGDFNEVLYVKTYSRNEALDLTVYCHAGLFALQHFFAPAISWSGVR